MVSTPAPGSMAEAQGPRRPRRKRTIDRPRLSSFEALRRINGEGGYANLVTAEVIAGLDARDAGFVTELVHGTCRRQGSYDMIIERAAGRTLNSLQPAVVDVLRLACHQLFVMRVRCTPRWLPASILPGWRSANGSPVWSMPSSENWPLVRGTSGWPS